MKLDRMNKFGQLVALLLLAILTLLINQIAIAEPEAPAAPEASPNWENATLISTSTSNNNGAIQPSIAASQNGSKVIIAYNQLLTDNNNKDIYFSRSTNYGDTWASPQRIHSSPGSSTNSSLVNMVIGSNNKAHAVWKEGDTIVYKHEDNWGNNSSNLKTISAPASPNVISEPKIVANDSNRLDVVWAQATGGNPNIYHAYSTNSGASWSSPSPIAITAPASRLPVIAIDQSGKYHVVWEESTFPQSTVSYVQGTLSGSTISWTSTPVNISVVSPPLGAARQPVIIAQSNTIHVSYTDYVSGSEQYVHHIQCSSSCISTGNWQSTNNPVSGQVLGAKASDPFDVISTMSTLGPCTYVYFHGIQGDVTSNSERIWGVNSCSGWSASARDQVTSSSVRAINPSMTAQNNWWIHLAYEQVSADNSDRQVYFVRNQPALYLPFITK